MNRTRLKALVATLFLSLAVTSTAAALNDKDGDGSYADDPVAANKDCDDGASCAAGDTACLDKAKAVNPGATEVAGNNVDDNCNGTVDEAAAAGGNVDDTVSPEQARTAAVSACVQQEALAAKRCKALEDEIGDNFDGCKADGGVWQAVTCDCKCPDPLIWHDASNQCLRTGQRGFYATLTGANARQDAKLKVHDAQFGVIGEWFAGETRARESGDNELRKEHEAYKLEQDEQRKADREAKQREDEAEAEHERGQDEQHRLTRVDIYTGQQGLGTRDDPAPGTLRWTDLVHDMQIFDLEQTGAGLRFGIGVGADTQTERGLGDGDDRQMLRGETARKVCPSAELFVMGSANFGLDAGVLGCYMYEETEWGPGEDSESVWGRQLFPYFGPEFRSGRVTAALHFSPYARHETSRSRQVVSTSDFGLGGRLAWNFTDPGSFYGGEVGVRCFGAPERLEIRKPDGDLDIQKGGFVGCLLELSGGVRRKLDVDN